MTERERFIEAFNAELAKNPGVAPGPTALSRRMGLRSRNNINGRLSRLRGHLLREAGFVKVPAANGWYGGNRWRLP